MVIAISNLVTRFVGALPKRVVRALDDWSYGVAMRRREARRHFGERKVAPLPPVITGRTYLPHPWCS